MIHRFLHPARFFSAVACTATIAIAASSASASAQEAPYGQRGNWQASHAHPWAAARGGGQNNVRGVITSFNQFDMQLDARGNSLPVHLHQGTVINPTGTTLHSGINVAVIGHRANGVFEADEIDVVPGSSGRSGYERANGYGDARDTRYNRGRGDGDERADQRERQNEENGGERQRDDGGRR